MRNRSKNDVKFRKISNLPKLKTEHDKKPIGEKSLLLIKIEKFYQQQQLLSEEPFPHAFWA